MLKHNSYHDGKVQSLAFERHGRRQTVGVVLPGEYQFTTDGAERMTVVNGELSVRIAPGAWASYPAGTSFEIPAHTTFALKAAAPSAYWCEFL